MEAGSVSAFPIGFPAGRETELVGIHLGGACFQAADGVEILELGTGQRTRLNGSGEAVLANADLILRSDSGRLSAWHSRTGRRLWETTLTTRIDARPSASSWWRGAITEERWQGFVIRRSRPISAVAIPGAVAVAGETSVEAWMP
jgi:hypothetical protein